MSITPGTCADCGGGGGGGGGFTPQETLQLTPGSYTYIVPVDATMITFEAVAGGGGGGSGGTKTSGPQYGAGGGGGGGRTVKTISAAALRAAYPSGVPYTVGAGGAGAVTNVTPNTNGTFGGAGGFTFAGDFVVATPGSVYSPAYGGGATTLTGGVPSTGFGGTNGLGDTYAATGGLGGGFAYQLLNYPSSTSPEDYSGTGGGFPAIATTGINPTISTYTSVALGGGGGGGGGGGIGTTGIAWGGGASGFAITGDPTPIAGSGGVVGGASPTAAGNSVIAGVMVQGGGGGGAASVTGNAQAGASALANSGSGGGGGGSSRTGNGGAGGNGGSGFMRIVAF